MLLLIATSKHLIQKFPERTVLSLVEMAAALTNAPVPQHYQLWKQQSNNMNVLSGCPNINMASMDATDSVHMAGVPDTRSNMLSRPCLFSRQLKKVQLTRHIKAKHKTEESVKTCTAWWSRGLISVDLLDRLLSSYRPMIRGKKWWWPLFLNTLNVSVVAAWRLYNAVSSSSQMLDHLSFRHQIVIYLLKGSAKNVFRLAVDVKPVYQIQWGMMVLGMTELLATKAAVVCARRIQDPNAQSAMPGCIQTKERNVSSYITNHTAENFILIWHAQWLCFFKRIWWWWWNKWLPFAFSGLVTLHA